MTRQQRTIREFDDMSCAIPGFRQVTSVFQSQLVTNSKFDLAALELGECEVSDSLLIQPNIPA
jgi:hypothetical protein